MKLVVGLWHPAHVHFFKNFIWEMEAQGHDVTVFSRLKEHSIHLLDHHGINYTLVGKHIKGSLSGKIKNIFTMVKEARSNIIKMERKPDMVMAVGALPLSIVGRLHRIPSLAFSDDDLWVLNTIYVLVCKKFLTPQGFSLRFKKLFDWKRIGYAGYHELAYLHPKRFTPDPLIYDFLNISENQPYIIMRFVAWAAAHDRSQKGFPLETVAESVRQFEEKGYKVFISSEAELPGDLEKNKIKIPPELIHHALAYATLVIADSQTMTTEAAILGTPVVRSNSFVGPRDLSNFKELEERYGLIFNIRDPKAAMAKGLELVDIPDLKEQWARKREKLLDEKIDVTAFMVWFVENYPESFKTMKKDPSIMDRFR